MRNKVQLIGNLGNDPEARVLNGSQKMVKMSLATNENYKNADGEKVQTTQWHKLVLWGKTADVAEKYLKKGSEVAVEGKINYRNYTDNNGEKHYITEIVVNELLMLDSKK